MPPSINKDTCCSILSHRVLKVRSYSRSPPTNITPVVVMVWLHNYSYVEFELELLSLYCYTPIIDAIDVSAVAECDATSVALNLLWQSDRHATTNRLSPSKCDLVIVPSSDTCYIRWMQMLHKRTASATSGDYTCDISWLHLLNQATAPVTWGDCTLYIR